ncbi:ABC transporter permease [Vallitalea sp.]|uniref:ABC transporter permease n=1 Tax=Vallitalea sp. TaxID=1882829 RepID=UPI0025E7EFE3|nr:ABC transporter permease [Vallitalea sp.]MCT4686561.1 ABC transporter permease [Vallitalea sp.]
MNNHNMSPEQNKYLRKVYKERKVILLYQIIILAVLIITWEICSLYGIIDSFIFSSPSRIVKTFIEMLMDGSLLYHIWVTLYETIISFALGSILGIIIAIILWWNNKISKILEPYLIVFNSLPKTALAPIFIVWLGHNKKSIIVTALTVAIVVTIINVFNGFSNVDKEKVKLIYTFNGKKIDVLKKVIIPANFSNIISTMKVNIGLSFIGVIIGEFIAGRAGLGQLIVYGSQVLKMDWVMMSIILLALLATGLYELIVFAEKKVNKFNE